VGDDNGVSRSRVVAAIEYDYLHAVDFVRKERGGSGKCGGKFDAH